MTVQTFFMLKAIRLLQPPILRLACVRGHRIYIARYLYSSQQALIDKLEDGDISYLRNVRQ